MTSSILRVLRAATIAAAVTAAGTAGAQEPPRPGNFLDNLFGGQQRQQRSGPDEADLAVRINQLESQIRQLTGTIEQLQHRNQQLEQQLRGGGSPPQPGMSPQAGLPQPGMPPQAGLPQQAQPLPPAGRPPSQAQPLPVPSAALPPPPPGPGRRGDAFDPSINPNAPGAPRALGGGPAPTQSAGIPAEPPPVIMADPPVGVPAGRGPGEPLDLSTLQGSGREQGGLLPPPPSRNLAATGGAPPTAPPSNVPKDYYDLAYGYVLRKDYAYAEDAFQTFLKKYPNDKLVPDAQFWLGESLFQRQRYDAAAEQFLALSTKSTSHPKAPDALLRLGQSLAALKQKEMACATLAEVGRKYPRASNSVKQGVEREQKRVRC
jgi:tol-pal system protein YbgF